MSEPPKPSQVLVRYGEIGLKSPGVRRQFEILLHKHLVEFLTRQRLPYSKIQRERGRLFIKTTDPHKVAGVTARVFGVVSSSPVWTVPSKPAKITEITSILAPQLLQNGQTFAVRARRVKTHTFTSQEIASQVGAAILKSAKKNNQSVSVDLNNPTIEIHVEIRQKTTYIFTEIIQGPGGLPYGSQGTLIGLHSGEIDSPVAQWLMMKRGARVIPLYFDSAISPDHPIRTRAIETAQILAHWVPEKHYELLIIPYYEILKQFQKSKNPKITCILCKRMMFRIAAMVASQVEAQALVSGENLGQVASQTLRNLTILDSAIAVPVFRPLFGFDKNETIALARQIGSYDASSKDVGSCFVVPKQPTFAASLEQVHEVETELPIPEMITTALSEIERVPLEK